jgi:hypothetical protein
VRIWVVSDTITSSRSRGREAGLMGVLTLAFVASAALVPVAAGAQWVTSPAWTTFAPSADVSFTISTDRTSYSVREPIVVKYRIVNVGNRMLRVPRDWLEGCPTVGVHVMVWLEDSVGRYYLASGYAASCDGSGETLTKRMAREAVLIGSGEHFDSTVPIGVPSGSDLRPGTYRIGATLSGWSPDRFTEAELAELAQMQHPFLHGETLASIVVTLTR